VAVRVTDAVVAGAVALPTAVRREVGAGSPRITLTGGA
jgi:hypothetical protein